MGRHRALLNQLLDRYHRAEFLGSDPLEFPHRFRDPWDQEAVALVAALLAYGNVKQIRRSVEDALARIETLGHSPRSFVQSLGEAKEFTRARLAFETFVHRFNKGSDLILLFGLLERSWRAHGSLGAHFLSGLRADDRDISQALDRLIGDWRASVASDKRLAALRRRSPSFEYLLTAPKDGSCCKRWCMFLRWMGRGPEDGVDLGLWTQGAKLVEGVPHGLAPSQLVIPLDTHTGRISQKLGLTRRKSLNWLAALEVTEALRAYDAQDPVKYDFALCRVGILRHN